MVNLTREQIQKIADTSGWQSVREVCDMALRTHDAEQQRDQARQEAARLRGALEGIEKRTRNRVPDPGPCVDCVWGIASDALQSAAPASEPEPWEVGDKARTVFHGIERECRLTSQHDPWDFRNRWYVDVLAEDGRPLGHTIRHERDLMPSTDPTPVDRPEPSEALERLRDGRDVPMPKNEEHARALAAVGLKYLEDSGLSQPAPADAEES